MGKGLSSYTQKLLLCSSSLMLLKPICFKL